MKWLLIATTALLVFSGCQSFRYYDPNKPHRGKTQFFNNYDNSPKANFWKWQWERMTKSVPAEPEFKPEVLKTDVAFLQGNQSENTLTWIGHSSTLLQIDGVNILMDPVFSDRVSPVSFLGPKRLVALPFSLSELPHIDIVVISHAHYDHMDIATLKALAQRDTKTLFLVPLGNEKFLQSEGLTNVKELDWWETNTAKDVTLTFTPAQHWTARGLFDSDETLWGGWHVKGINLSVLYTGDTGYSKDFADIRERLGSVDLALIPIGAYEPRWFMQKQHVNPEEALFIHRDLGAQLSIGVHWGTFRLADEFMQAPSDDIQTAIQTHPEIKGVFRVMKHGEILKLKN